MLFSTTVTDSTRTQYITAQCLYLDSTPMFVSQSYSNLIHFHLASHVCSVFLRLSLIVHLRDACNAGSHTHACALLFTSSARP